MTVPLSIAEKLAEALRAQGQCLCHRKNMWPWKRDQQCKMCEALEALAEHKKIVQYPREKP